MRKRMDLTEGHLKLMNIPRQFWNAAGRDLSEGNIKVALSKYFETRYKLYNSSYRDGQGIFIRGPSDSSKTHITVICCKALKRYGYSVYFITAGELQRFAENGDEYEEGKRAIRAKAENGDWPYRHTPLGYVLQKEKNKYGASLKGTARLVRDPNSRHVDQVNREFLLRSEGRSYDAIAEIMWHEGWIESVTQAGYRATLTKRLKNPLYWGYFYITGDPKRYEGRHELIIPKEILDKVQAINEGNPNRPTRPANADGVFADGWIKCAHPDCGLQMVYDPKEKTIKATGEKKVYQYYRCSNRRKVHAKVVNTTEDKIVQDFDSAVEAFTITEEFAEDIRNALNEAHDKQNQAIKVQAEGHRHALMELERSEDRAYGLLDDGTIDKDIYRKKIEQIRKQRDYYNRKLEELNIAISDAGFVAVEEVFELAINAKLQWKLMDRQKRMEYLKEVCSNPVLDELTIRYCLQEPFARLASWRENSNWRRG